MGLIYVITNPIGQKYIGRTTMTLHSRMLSYSSNNCKMQPKIYKSILEYGWVNHTVESIEYNNDLLKEKEDFYIKKYNSIESGLNCYSNKNTGAYYQMETSILRSKQKVSVFDIKTVKLIKVFDSPYQAALFLNIKSSSISSSIKSVFTVNNKYIFVRSDDGGTKIDYKPYTGGNVYCAKSVLQIDLDGNVVNQFSNMKEAGRVNGINYKNIQSVCSGKRPKAGGYVWRYMNEEKEGITVDHFYKNK